MFVVAERDGLRLRPDRRNLWRRRRQLGSDAIFSRRQSLEVELSVLVSARLMAANAVVRSPGAQLQGNLRAGYGLAVLLVRNRAIQLGAL